MLKSMSPKKDPWGTQVIIGLQLDVDLLTKTLQLNHPANNSLTK